jgi:hypothetical protein
VNTALYATTTCLASSGITRRQYAQVKHIPGVAVAAPIANIGTVLPAESVSLPLGRFLTDARDQLLRVHFSWEAQRGLSHYPGGDVYVCYTKHRFFLWPSQSPYSKVVVSDPGGLPQPLPICDGFGGSRPTRVAPFARINSKYLVCYSTRLSAGLRSVDRKYGGLQLAPRVVTVRFTFSLPIVLAAIDPVEEARLVRLDQAWSRAAI